MESVRLAETKIIEMLKSIKGELPLPGLVERIDNYLNSIDVKHNLQITDGSKRIKFVKPKK